MVLGRIIHHHHIQGKNDDFFYKKLDKLGQIGFVTLWDCRKSGSRYGCHTYVVVEVIIERAHNKTRDMNQQLGNIYLNLKRSVTSNKYIYVVQEMGSVY